MLPYRDSRFVRLTLILCFLAVLAYAFFEAQGVLAGPTIHVPEETITVHEALTSIQGRAERISELRLNGKIISVTENGEFNEPYLLAEGTNRLILEAKDARGRTARTTLDVVYLPPPGTPSPTVSLPVSTTTATTSPTR